MNYDIEFGFYGQFFKHLPTIFMYQEAIRLTCSTSIIYRLWQDNLTSSTTADTDNKLIKATV